MSEDSNRPSLRGDTRGQAEVVGVVLVLGLAFIGSVTVIAFGMSAVDSTQQQSQVQRVEHAMTQFDSQISLVALGNSDARTVSLGLSEGTYSADHTEGTITVEHINWDGSGSNEVIISAAELGTITYETGGTKIAYQGGGVFRKDSTGESRMVSPPEFHYRGSTLTLPIVQVTDGNAGSGEATARVSKTGSPQTEIEYPNADAEYDPGIPYKNPQEEGHVEITVQSEYYEAWANYFEARTDADVTKDDASNEVTAELLSTGITGQFAMPGHESSITPRGIEDHSLEEFTITLLPDDDDSADFANLQWTMYVEEGDEQFEMHLRHGSGGACDTAVIDATIFYSPPDGDPDRDDPYHGWQADGAYETECIDRDDDGTADEAKLVVDFVDDEDNNDGVHDVEAGDPSLTYTSLSSSDLVKFNPSGDPVMSSVEFSTSSHSFSPDWEHSPHPDEPFNDGDGDNVTVDRLVNHYFSNLGPGFDLTVHDQASDTVEEDDSEGVIDYAPGGQFITYLHVTRNKVVVEFE